MPGEGSSSKLGVKTEVTAGTGVAPTSTLPFTSEGFSAPKELIPSETIGGTAMVETVAVGLQRVSGSITQEFDGETAGQMLYYWNGDNGYTDEGSTTDGRITSAPSGSASGSGADLAAGDYIYKVAAVLQHAYLKGSDGNALKVIMPASTASSAVTVTSGQEVALTFTDPTGLTMLTDFTYAGTAIYRSETDGLAATCYFVAYQSGTGASFTDDGADTYADTNVAPVGATTLYEHTFVGAAPAAGQDRLKSFSVQISKNVGSDERYTGNKCNEFNLEVPDAGSPVTATYSMIGSKVETVTGEFSASSPTIRRQIMGYNCVVVINDTVDCEVRSFSFTGSNGADYNDGFCLTTITTSQLRQLTGNFSLAFKDRTLFSKAINAEEIELQLIMYGEPTTPNGSTLSAVSHNVTAIPIPRIVKFDWQRVNIGELTNPVEGPGQIIQSINWQALKDSVTSTDMTITMLNTTSAYA